MTEGSQEKSVTETKAKGQAQSSPGHPLAEKRRENKLRKKMAHRRNIARSNTTG